MARDGVGTGFEGLLIYSETPGTVVRVGGECAALAGFEVEDVFSAGLVVDAASVQLAGHCVCFAQERDADAEGGVGRFGSGDGLEEKVEWRALPHGVHLRGEMREDAALGGNVVALTDVVDEVKKGCDGGDVVGDGVDADDGVAGAEEEAVENAGGDADWVVRWMVGLEARGETAGKANGRAEAGDDGDFAGGVDEVLHAHELGDGGGHLGRQTWGECGE